MQTWQLTDCKLCSVATCTVRKRLRKLKIKIKENRMEWRAKYRQKYSEW